MIYFVCSFWFFSFLLLTLVQNQMAVKMKQIRRKKKLGVESKNKRSTVVDLDYSSNYCDPKGVMNIFMDGNNFKSCYLVCSALSQIKDTSCWVGDSNEDGTRNFYCNNVDCTDIKKNIDFPINEKKQQTMDDILDSITSIIQINATRFVSESMNLGQRSCQKICLLNSYRKKSLTDSKRDIYYLGFNTTSCHINSNECFRETNPERISFISDWCDGKSYNFKSIKTTENSCSMICDSFRDKGQNCWGGTNPTNSVVNGKNVETREFWCNTINGCPNKDYFLDLYDRMYKNYGDYINGRRKIGTSNYKIACHDICHMETKDADPLHTLSAPVEIIEVGNLNTNFLSNIKFGTNWNDEKQSLYNVVVKEGLAQHCNLVCSALIYFKENCGFIGNNVVTKIMNEKTLGYEFQCLAKNGLPGIGFFQTLYSIIRDREKADKFVSGSSKMKTETCSEICDPKKE